jgi:enoyl-CoA hydratase
MAQINLHIHQQMATLEIHRPNKAHAYTQQMLQELNAAWQRVEAQCSVVVIQSSGDRHFCAGADLTEMKQKRAEDALDLLSQRIFNRIATSHVVSIAAIQGPAVAGGFELALACDLRVAHPDAWFGLPEVSLGLIPSAGGCTRLTQLMGQSIAKSVILGGERISATRALQWGLVHRVDVQPKENAVNWAQKICQQDPLAIRLAKQVLEDPSLERERLAEAILYERRHGKA